MLSEYALKKVLDEGLKQCSRLLKNEQCELLTTPEVFQEAIKNHSIQTANWCKEIGIVDAREPKYTINSFVPLELYVMPKYISSCPEEEIDKVSLHSLINDKKEFHSVILGYPGSGKTTSIKYICNQIITDDKLGARYKVIIAIRLRDLNSRVNPKKSKNRQTVSKNLLFNYMAGILGIKFKIPTDIISSISEQGKASLLEGAVLSLLNSMNALVLLDGFDEISNYSDKQCVLSEFRSMSLGLREAYMILTSRTGEFQYAIDNARVYEICPLNDAQVFEFSIRWLGSEASANEFINQLSKSPYLDTSLRPLNLAHLCAIFERTAQIPAKPKTVYRKIVDLLIRDWDEQRSVIRHSIYSEFEPDRKFDFLTSMSYKLSLANKQMTFTTQMVEKIYRTICPNFDLPADQAKIVSKEIESHTGLIIQSSQNSFEFCHKSIQEYLAAEHLVRLPAIPSDDKILNNLPNELAIAVAISSDTSLYFSTLIFERFYYRTLPRDFISIFVARLLQEKPDFNTSDDVVIALLVLYSMYILETQISGNIQYRLFYDDASTTEFTALIDKVAHLNSLNVIKNEYHLFRDLREESGIDLIEFRKKDSCSIRYYPTILLIKSEMVKSIIGVS